MKLAKDTKLGGEIILAEEACYERHHDYLRCPECGEMVFWVRGTEYERGDKSIRKSAYFAHHQGDGLECELRVKSYSQERLLSLYSDAKNQRLSILKKHLEMMLLEGFGLLSIVGEDCSKMSPSQIYKRLEKTYSSHSKIHFQSMPKGRVERFISIAKNQLKKPNVALHPIFNDLQIQDAVKSMRMLDKMTLMYDNLLCHTSYATENTKNAKRVNDLIESRILNRPTKSDNYYTVSGFKNNRKIGREVLDLLFNSYSMRPVIKRFLHCPHFVFLNNVDEATIVLKFFEEICHTVDWLTLINKYSGLDETESIKQKRLDAVKKSQLSFEKMSTDFKYNLADAVNLIKSDEIPSIGYMDAASILSSSIEVLNTANFLSKVTTHRNGLNITYGFYLYLHDNLSKIVDQVRDCLNYDLKKYFSSLLPVTSSGLDACWDDIFMLLTKLFSRHDLSELILQCIVLFEMYRSDMPSANESDVFFCEETAQFIPLDEIALRFLASSIISTQLFCIIADRLKPGELPVMLGHIPFLVNKMLYAPYGVLEQMKNPIAL